MSEREKEILTSIGKALLNMSEFDKGYLLGIAEGNISKQRNGQGIEGMAEQKQENISVPELVQQ